MQAAAPTSVLAPAETRWLLVRSARPPGRAHAAILGRNQAPVFYLSVAEKPLSAGEQVAARFSSFRRGWGVIELVRVIGPRDLAAVADLSEGYARVWARAIASDREVLLTMAPRGARACMEASRELAQAFARRTGRRDFKHQAGPIEVPGALARSLMAWARGRR